MNTRLFKSAGLLCLLSLLSFSEPIVNAEATTNTIARFDIQIEDGQLSLEPLKGRADMSEISDVLPPPPSIEATIANLTKYLRAIDTNLNIVVSTQAAAVKINNLKLHAANMTEVVNAAEVATDEAVRGGTWDGKINWFFETQARKNPTRTLEVFNISGYIHSLHNSDENGLHHPNVVHQKLDEIQQLIGQTLKELNQDDPAHPPEFNFHPGTGLLIVIGSPEAIEVTRKIVDALPGISAAQFEQLEQEEKIKQLQLLLDKPDAQKQK